MTELSLSRARWPACLQVALSALALGAPVSTALGQAARVTPPRMADFIVAVVNQELVTNAEVEQRLASIRQDAARSKAQLPLELPSAMRGADRFASGGAP